MDERGKGYVPAEYNRGYSVDVDGIREREFPLLKDTTYLDHAGTTLYAHSLIESFSRDLTSNLFGNPHSMSASSQLSTHRVDDIRLRALRFFNADPEEFDLVFVANATAAIKLVSDALRDSTHKGFWYGYHVDAHTSLVGVREVADMGNRCFFTDEEVDTWTSELSTVQAKAPKLFAYPAQSNMNGRRLPLRWCEEVRKASGAEGNVFTLLDAASFVSTAQLDLSDVSSAPDFTVLSFYKIFGFPDLGALIVRKSAGHVFSQRRFFGGGTVDMVLTKGIQWHAKKESIHGRLEDGTLPFHSIIALDSAFEVHKRLYGTMSNISSHTRFLAKQLYDRLFSLAHYNGVRVSQFYKSPISNYEDPSTQGPIVSFNLRNSHGGWIGKTEVERLAAVKDIQIRSGSLCNPGGTSSSLGWNGPDLRRHFSSGLRCGDDHDVMDGRPTGILRVSLGAMTNMKDIDTIVSFVEEFYVEKATDITVLPPHVPGTSSPQQSGFYIESLSVYPIKSCGAFKVPDGKRWEIRREGLAWDREWCLVHQGTGATLNQKKYPRMALIRPFIDLDQGVLRMTCGGMTSSGQKSMEVSLFCEDTNLVSTSLCQNSKKSSTVCGDQVVVQAYSLPDVSAFFSDFLGVPCTLARFPPQSSTRYSRTNRLFSASLKQAFKKFIMPGSFPQDPLPPSAPERSPILLSNESPILVVSRSSMNRLNETIKANARKNNSNDNNNGNNSNDNNNGNNSPGKAVAADVFRSNIVVAENVSHFGNVEQPYIEDNWSALSIGPSQLRFDVLGSCQRCQMVCIDQLTGVRGDEPLSTLAKTRKVNGKIFFGSHASLAVGEIDGDEYSESSPGKRTVMVGDRVVPLYDDESRE